MAENICLGRLPKRWGRIDWAAVRARLSACWRRWTGHRRGPPLHRYSRWPSSRWWRLRVRCATSAKVLISTSPPPAWTTRPCSSCLRCCAACVTRAGHPLHPLPDQTYASPTASRSCATARPRASTPPTWAAWPWSTRWSAPPDRQRRRLATTATADGAPVLQAKKIGPQRRAAALDVSLRRGEVLGLAGLLGSGSHGAGPFAVWCRCGRTEPPAAAPRGAQTFGSPREPLPLASPSARKTASTRAASWSCRCARTSCLRCRRAMACAS